MKDSYIRFRCTEQEKKMIELLSMADPYSDSISEYILDLIRENAKYYTKVTIEAAVYGPNKAKTETLEKKRIVVGEALVDEDGRMSAKTYDHMIKAAHAEFGDLPDRPAHYMKLIVDGKELKTPNPMASFIRV